MAAIARRGTWAADLHRIGNQYNGDASLMRLHAALLAHNAPGEAWTSLISGVLEAGTIDDEELGAKSAVRFLQRVVLLDPDVATHVARGTLQGFLLAPGTVHSGERAELGLAAAPAAITPFLAMARRILCAAPELRANRGAAVAERHIERLAGLSLQGAWESAGGRDRSSAALLEFALAHAWHYHQHWNDGTALVRAALTVPLVPLAASRTFRGIIRDWQDPARQERTERFLIAALYRCSDPRRERPVERVLTGIATVCHRMPAPPLRFTCRVLALLGKVLATSGEVQRETVSDAIATMLMRRTPVELLRALPRVDFRVGQLLLSQLHARGGALLREPRQAELARNLKTLAHADLSGSSIPDGHRNARIDALLDGLIDGRGSRADRMFDAYELLSISKGPLDVPDEVPDDETDAQPEHSASARRTPLGTKIANDSADEMDSENDADIADIADEEDEEDARDAKGTGVRDSSARGASGQAGHRDSKSAMAPAATPHAGTAWTGGKRTSAARPASASSLPPLVLPTPLSLELGAIRSASQPKLPVAAEPVRRHLRFGQHAPAAPGSMPDDPHSQGSEDSSDELSLNREDS